ncbi:hypothetical protein R3P38DRAFT_2793070 [Favolaschia claudopus]|uniref:Uncharacterized protein n=1 Tax=Favolaschia claudopus TaxID=2862362 RepID=A0AAW0AEL4_9AGAR
MTAISWLLSTILFLSTPHYGAASPSLFLRNNPRLRLRTRAGGRHLARQISRQIPPPTRSPRLHFAFCFPLQQRPCEPDIRAGGYCEEIGSGFGVFAGWNSMGNQNAMPSSLTTRRPTSTPPCTPPPSKRPRYVDACVGGNTPFGRVDSPLIHRSSLLPRTPVRGMDESRQDFLDAALRRFSYPLEKENSVPPKARKPLKRRM